MVTVTFCLISQGLGPLWVVDIKAGVMGGGEDRDPEMFLPSTPPFLFTHASTERSGLWSVQAHTWSKKNRSARERREMRQCCVPRASTAGYPIHLHFQHTLGWKFLNVTQSSGAQRPLFLSRTSRGAMELEQDFPLPCFFPMSESLTQILKKPCQMQMPQS